MRRRPEPVSVNDPELVELSALLSRRAMADAAPTQHWRSADGLRARTSVFRVLDPAIDTVDTKRTAMSDQVWSKFHQTPHALWAAAATARQSMAHSSEPKEEATTIPVRPSRGPSAWSGLMEVSREDGVRWVYVMQLVARENGPWQLQGLPIVKVGRSNNVARRAAEMNTALPPILGIRWKPVDSILMKNEDEAHRVEQSVLNALCSLGVTVGGEFARAAPVEAGRLVRAHSASNLD